MASRHVHNKELQSNGIVVIQVSFFATAENCSVWSPRKSCYSCCQTWKEKIGWPKNWPGRHRIMVLYRKQDVDGTVWTEEIQMLRDFARKCCQLEKPSITRTLGKLELQWHNRLACRIYTRTLGKLSKVSVPKYFLHIK